ncbi:cytochrome P450 [Nakamurella sp. PAMC28650]|uniref:cytochrome P450 n=1 Tax=Nakamurella sp. PAMC28650 TaxID=2762325 RepID=UPI00164E4CF5|nr:cytochrome P450 [Nakamurella sp. PAMC28650]QNK79357.1 cytochrome P450 [Nakamurella sp. PAMC28650]
MKPDVHLNRLLDPIQQETRLAVRWGLGHQLPRTVMAIAGRRGDLQGQMVAAAGRNGDPFAAFERMRARGPLYRGRFAYVTTSLPVAREVLSSHDSRARSNRRSLSGPVGRLLAWAGTTRALGPLDPPSLLATEPPEHTRYRKLVTRVFSARAVAALRERAEVIAGELLDELAGRRTVDLVPAYCTRLPLTMIGQILGVPASEYDRVLAFGQAAAPSLDLGLSWSTFRRVDSSLRDFDVWLGEHLARLRADPQDDLLSQLVMAQDDGVGLTEIELRSIAGLVLSAGFETTVNLLGNGIALLLEHPAQRAVLERSPELWPNAIDEMLRIDPPVLLTGRTAERDTELAGVPIPRGAVVTAALAGANRDPEVFTDPARFDVARHNAKEHVSFSAGRHFCLGAALVRMEGEVGLRSLFARYPHLKPQAGARRRDTRILRGYERFPVELGSSTGLSVATG